MAVTETQARTKWIVDHANSQIGFKVKHLMFSTVRGMFREFDASIYTTGEDFLSAEIDFWINPASIDTGHEKRDAHLKGADFFDTGRYRKINFSASTFFEVDKDGNYELYGQLTMKGVKKQIKLNVESGGILRDPWGSDRALIKVYGRIDRKDWGLKWNAALATGGVLVSEDVWINCELQLTKHS